MSNKDTNPKDAVGVAKAPFSTVSMPVMAELGLVMMEGARKYGRHNYRAVGVRASVYFDAALRHLAQFWEGEDLDPDSGMPHLIHAMACCVVLRDSQIQENWTDDRPPKTPSKWMKPLNDHAADLLVRYPNSVPPYTELQQPVKDGPRQWDSLADVPTGDVRHVVSAKGCHWKFWLPGEKNDMDAVATHVPQWLWNSRSGAKYDKTGPFTEDIDTETNDSVLLSNDELKLAEIKALFDNALGRDDNWAAAIVVIVKHILDSPTPVDFNEIQHMLRKKTTP